MIIYISKIQFEPANCRDQALPGQVKSLLLLHAEQGLSGIDGFSTLPLKTDRTFSDLADLHAGQVTFSFSSLDLKRTSKSFPQSLHRNSKIGNCASSEKKEDFGPSQDREGAEMPAKCRR
jgi:hypothetical protein